ncbi:DUF4124 domain-containing protein [Shewanella sp. UCD-KL12]|uniref:DUF4124 domain-containing protein n=1 Tax=Shewanella sp. UCD-KL12 TaxID=1917163 RepID=UPI000970F9B3|nr:DUF4124 domain-containing protein [Shewanella sp. UCD-KL12]
MIKPAASVFFISTALLMPQNANGLEKSEQLSEIEQTSKPLTQQEKLAEQHSAILKTLKGCGPENANQIENSPTSKGASEIYTWVDDKGQMHFSDNPRQSQQYQAELTDYHDTQYGFELNLKSTGGSFPVSYRDNVTAAIKKVSEIYKFYLPSSGVPEATVNLTLAKDRASYHKLVQQYAPGMGQSQGFYISEFNLAAVWYRNDAQAHQTSIHESVHVLNARLFGLTPRWFNEGMAEYFSAIKMQGHAAKLASPNWQQILSGTQLNLTALISAKVQHWNSGSIQSLLYAQSYSLVQYLMSTSKGKQTMKLLLAHLVDTRCEPNAQVNSILGQYPGGIRKLESDWIDWVNNKRYRSQSF